MKAALFIRKEHFGHLKENKGMKLLGGEYDEKRKQERNISNQLLSGKETEKIKKDITGQENIMVLTDELIHRGFSLKDVTDEDMGDYISIKRDCYKKYVDQYNGGWIDDIQTVINTDSFKRLLNSAFFQKVLLDGSTVGFFSYEEQLKKIDGISIQVAEPARNKGIGSFYLNYITSLSRQKEKPVFLITYKSNPVQGLLNRFGFKIYDESRTHYLMSFNQDDKIRLTNYKTILH